MYKNRIMVIALLCLGQIKIVQTMVVGSASSFQKVSTFVLSKKSLPSSCRIPIKDYSRLYSGLSKKDVDAIVRALHKPVKKEALIELFDSATKDCGSLEKLSQENNKIIDYYKNKRFYDDYLLAFAGVGTFGAANCMLVPCLFDSKFEELGLSSQSLYDIQSFGIVSLACIFSCIHPVLIFSLINREIHRKRLQKAEQNGEILAKELQKIKTDEYK